jgi:predicted Zn-dependent peptidase
VEVTLEEIGRIVREPVPASELERVRQLYIFDLEYSRDSAYDMGGRFGWGELMNMVRSIEEDQSEAAGITAEELLETARMVFRPENMRLVVVGPWQRGMKKRTRELLERYAEQFPAS